MEDGCKVCQLSKGSKRGGAEEERVEFGKVKEEEKEQRMTNGTAHSSSCRFLYPGPTLEKMEE